MSSLNFCLYIPMSPRRRYGQKFWKGNAANILAPFSVITTTLAKTLAPEE